ncbi:MAG: archaellar assembly protein FlaJ [Candidatus Syntrophoarchaeum sp.]|nr:archaellar assembly protein FlaJ [Candidatus Syntrophoarchaeum sp.]
MPGTMDCFDMPVDRYIKRFAAPIILMSFTFAAVVLLLFPDVFGEGIFRMVIYLIPLFGALVAVAYPKMAVDKKRADINNNMHYFITHMGVLATSDLTLTGIFELLRKKKEEYGALADEISKIFLMVDTWHLSMSEACRFVGRRTPSLLLSDFLDRLAHAMDAGEAMDVFLTSEQEVVMKQYDVVYRGQLYQIELMKEMYLSMVMALIFMASFAIIMPLITGVDPAQMITMTVFMFIFMEAVLVFFVNTKTPHEKLWHTVNLETEREQKIKRTIPVAITGCLLMLILILLLQLDLPLQLKAAIIFTPLILIGHVIKKAEADIKRRDDNFASFIRSLGASAAARGGIVDVALKDLRAHDFGALTQDVNNLYQRLAIRVNKMRSWYHFAAETGSSLIQRFSDMFIESIDVGGKADSAGNIISNNFIHIMGLRTQRYQTGSSLVGVMYGLTAGVAVTLYLSLGIVGTMQDLFSSTSLPQEVVGGMLQETLDPTILNVLLLVILVGHSFASAIMIKLVEGGSLKGATLHFVIMMWIGAMSSVLTLKGTASMIGGFGAMEGIT